MQCLLYLRPYSERFTNINIYSSKLGQKWGPEGISKVAQDHTDSEWSEAIFVLLVHALYSLEGPCVWFSAREIKDTEEEE